MASREKGGEGKRGKISGTGGPHPKKKGKKETGDETEPYVKRSSSFLFLRGAISRGEKEKKKKRGKSGKKKEKRGKGDRQPFVSTHFPIL